MDPHADVIRRSFVQDGTTSQAVFSPCERYRYNLTRMWDPIGPAIAFVMLNPSTADERRNDPTVARCMRYARRWGYGSCTAINLFAFRCTDPRGLRAAADPIGSETDRFLVTEASRVDRVICAWGNHGAYRDRAGAVLRLLVSQHDLYCLRRTNQGHPAHPLYLPGSLAPALYSARAEWPASGDQPASEAQPASGRAREIAA